MEVVVVVVVEAGDLQVVAVGTGDVEVVDEIGAAVNH